MTDRLVPSGLLDGVVSGKDHGIVFHDGKQVIRIILSGSKVLQGGLDKGIQNAFVGIGDRDHHAGKDHTYCQDEHTA